MLTCTVVGQFLDSLNNPLAGTVVFRASVPVVTLAGDVIISDPIRVFMDATGSISATLPATNDPATNPTGFTYEATINAVGLPPRSFSFSAPSGVTVDLVTVIPVTSSSGTVSSISALLASTADTIAGVSTSSAVTPAGAAVIAEKYDVRRSGAVGDGVTNNKTALDAAFAVVAAAGGGKALFPPGNYLVNSTLADLAAPIIVEGAGAGLNPGTAVTQLTFAAGVPGLALGTASHGSTIRGLYLKSNSTIDGTDDGIIFRAGRCRVEDVIVQGFGRYGVVADTTGPENCNLLHIEKVRAYLNRSHGFFLTGNDTNLCKLIGCSAVSNLGWGFRQEGTATNLVLSPHAQSNTLGDYYDAGASNHWYDVYSEGGGTFEIATGSTYGVLVCGSYALPNIVANAAAITSWTVLSSGRWMRQIRVGPTPADSNQNVFKWGIGSPNGGDFYFQNETVGPTRVWWVHRSTHAMTVDQTLIPAGALNHTGTTVGFNGATPVGKRTLGAAATDAATTQTLANNLRQALIDLGLGQT